MFTCLSLPAGPLNIPHGSAYLPGWHIMMQKNLALSESIMACQSELNWQIA